jgi:hypothetical protein
MDFIYIFIDKFGPFFELINTVALIWIVVLLTGVWKRFEE